MGGGLVPPTPLGFPPMGANTGLHGNQMIKMSLKTTRLCAVPSCEKNVFALLPSDPDVRKE